MNNKEKLTILIKEVNNLLSDLYRIKIKKVNELINSFQDSYINEIIN